LPQRRPRDAGTEISLSTGLWIAGDDPERRYAQIAAWTDQPELVSLNLSEPGWEELAALLAAAVPLGHDIRAGLEDVLELPGGEIAPGNSELCRAAIA
jgi:uncharacterized protein (DUF849 family)